MATTRKKSSALHPSSPSSQYSVSPADLAGLRTYPLASRPSKVQVKQFARPHRRGAGLRVFLDSLPRILAAEDLRAIVNAIREARANRRAILWGLGGHVIKVGLGPVLVDLLERGFISGLAMNGAALVHDFEVALSGGTSEDVEAVLGRGKFGMAEETGRYINQMAAEAQRDSIGLGEAAGRLLTNQLAKQRPGLKGAGCSVVMAAYQARIPVTVHLAIGADIPHMHRSASGAALGAATHHDFRLFCALVQQMQPGGIYLNWGSAVLLPEIFLKAVTVARNLGTPLRPITTANFDFIQHYRPLQNVVKRPTASAADGGARSHGYALTGHHEIMMPLLAAALIESGRNSKR
jgi:hypothetical protein